jgi:hypothetical protein
LQFAGCNLLFLEEAEIMKPYALYLEAIAGELPALDLRNLRYYRQGKQIASQTPLTGSTTKLMLYLSGTNNPHVLIFQKEGAQAKYQ